MPSVLDRYLTPKQLQRKLASREGRKSRAQEQREEQKTALVAQIRKMGLRKSRLVDAQWYSEYLKSEHWIRFKESYRVSDRLQGCLVCGSPRYELHHWTYERLGCERLDDVVPLCRAHHAKTHELVKQGMVLAEAHLTLILSSS